MKKVFNYLKLMRVKHYIKNLLIFLPIIFSGKLFFSYKFFVSFFGFISFSLLSSIVYIINDYKDIDKDKKHPVKKFRPLASGVISKNDAVIAIYILSIIVFLINIFLVLPLAHNINFILLEILYLFLNVLYSFKLKDYPIIDIFILVSGFLIRLLFGGFICNIVISSWLFLTIMSLSFYMVLGKRRNELLKVSSSTRNVLKKYSKSFLDNYMNIFLALVIVFYSLWCIDPLTVNRLGDKAIYTVIFVIIILMKYSYDIEGDSFGDPVDVLYSDKVLFLLSILFCLVMLVLIYFRGVLL